MADRMDEGNALGDAPLAGWRGCPRPARTVLEGKLARVEPLDVARHADGLFDAFSVDREGRVWRYLASGPFADRSAFRSWCETAMGPDDPLFFAIVDVARAAPLGFAAYMRPAPQHCAVEVGSLAFSPALQRTAQATEAMYLMMRHAFDDLGYRRYEWKCNNANMASRAAANRLGFAFEGVFRNHMVVKGRSRDTAWYSIIAEEWPLVKRALETWLAPANFDEAGRQMAGLAAIRRGLAQQGEGRLA